MAPAIIERPSVAVYHLPELTTVSPSVASATDGAAPNNPAKLFGLHISPRTAKDETTMPPIRKRRAISVIVLPIYVRLFAAGLHQFSRRPWPFHI